MGLNKLGCQSSYIRGRVPSEYTMSLSDGETQSSLLGVERDGKDMEGHADWLRWSKTLPRKPYANAS